MTDLSHRVKKGYEKMLLPFEQARLIDSRQCMPLAHQTHLDAWHEGAAVLTDRRLLGIMLMMWAGS